MDEPIEKAGIIAAVAERLGTEPGAALAALLLARPPAEDLAAFEPDALALAVRHAADSLARHRPGTPLVRVERPEGLTEGATPLRLVTVVNDDKPFLFDSVLAELAENGSAIRYISHPVLEVAREGAGAPFAAARAAEPGSAGAPGRVSLIQVAADAPSDQGADERLARRLEAILAQVDRATGDFAAMRARVGQVAQALRTRAGADPSVAEASAFLDWLLAENFILLGTREYALGADNTLEQREGADLGILRDPAVRILRREVGESGTAPELQAFLQAPDPLIVAKANSRSLVHRRGYMDYVGVKEFDGTGRVTGELRVLGLFTSTAYTRPVLAIPFLRRKAESVIARFGFGSRSHSGKALANVLETYPRDELFQIDTDLLEQFAGAMVELGERPRVRVLPRIDRFDRFASVLVFVPRERYDSRLREKIGQLLADSYDGHVSAFYPSLPEGPLASVHFIIGRRGGPTPRPEVARLETRIAELARDWMDAFAEALGSGGDHAASLALAAGLPDAYRDAVAPRDAVKDAAHVAALTDDARLGIDFHRRNGDAETILRLKLYHLDTPLPLSTRVPILENMGFSAVSERSFVLMRPDGRTVHLHDMDLARRSGGAIPLADNGAALEAAYAAVSNGLIENDGFNALVFAAQLDWREANVLRAYGRYLRQTGHSYADGFIAATLERFPAIARALLALFAGAFDPARTRGAAGEQADDPQDRAAARRGVLPELLALREALDAVSSLDDDRILRRYLAAILATLRTNYYAVPTVSADPDSSPDRVHPALALKIDPHAVGGLPAPVPFREIFVFDARVEGVHLRFGRVARGGLRWSDRSQDYRTEVLGLVKAQQVKNAVIVPVGAKGGFLPKRLPDPAQRDRWFAAGRSAYIVFIASLLSVTDNVVGTDTRAPENVVAYDEPDPYFVVAADKGTATFSDTANAVALARGFWLGDAFASGGSAGYDHKAMGITARGAWEAVKRHFREMNRDIQAEPFTAVGCGDMSGDVFGNGMLLSRQTRLVAAFDHRDIFLDPDPDPAASFAERERLFALPRSSWADYDTATISAGGGVFSRGAKLIRLSGAAAAAIGWDRAEGTPAEVIAVILRAPVDLLWFGGIGTYLRAATESNFDVGDRANDALRVTGREVRARVVGEGANLAVTQAGRIEFARAGGRINTDAIDNSAGVNTSDVEVNIKIAFQGAMADGRLTREARDRLLAAMTPDVASLVLANNYGQTLAISLEEAAGPARLPLQARFMAALEDAGRLSRELEGLPSEAAIIDLKASGRGLTRPEIAVLLAYSKIDLFDRIVESPLPDDPYLADRLFSYFPPAMREEFAPDIAGHRLAREIVATGLAGDLVNRLGVSFASAMRDAAGAAPPVVAAAFVAARDGFSAGDLYRRIDALDGAVPGELQNALYAAVSQFLRDTTAWFARERAGASLADTVAGLRELVASLSPRLASLATVSAREAYESRLESWRARGVPEDLASAVALLPLLALLPDIGPVSRASGKSVEATVAAYFGVTQRLRIGRLEAAFAGLKPSDYYEMLALERAASQISRARRRMTASALAEGRGAEDAVAAWADRHDGLGRVAEQIGQLAGGGDTSVARLTLAAGLLLDLAG